MKYHPHNSTLFVTFSIEQGLLLLCNPLCEAIIKSCLAAAQSLYPVKICALMVEATHVHLVIVVVNPSDVPAFIRHFKTESAHALNGLLDRKKRTIWCEKYDSPIVLTPVRTLIALAYLYSNPAKDNLTDSVGSYPGVSSWSMFRSGEHRKKWKRLRRPVFTPISRDAHNLRGYTKIAERLLSESNETNEFVLEPNAWMETFGITDKDEQQKINNRLVERVHTIEERARKNRERDGKRVLGTHALCHQRLNTTWLPVRKGRRSWCLSEIKQLRIDFIEFLKDLFTKAREVSARWALGDYSVPYPPGLHPPSQPKLADTLAIW